MEHNIVLEHPVSFKLPCQGPVFSLPKTYKMPIMNTKLFHLVELISVKKFYIIKNQCMSIKVGVFENRSNPLWV